VSKESRVEIPRGSGNYYRYAYQDGATVYRGPVGQAPAIDEERFLEIVNGSSVKDQYPGLFMDTDGDGIPDVDDTEPLIPGGDWIEETSLAEEMETILEVREDYQDKLLDFKQELHDLSPEGVEVKGRVKTLYSVINKLRRKRMGGQKGITDMMGARIVARDQRELDQIRANIEAKYGSHVIEHEDFYENPLAGYRAHHYIIDLGDGMTVELQMKTERMAEISKASHSSYKAGLLDQEKMNEMTELALQADMGDPEARRRFDGYSQSDLSAMLGRSR